jgi:hypothetical protein
MIDTNNKHIRSTVLAFVNYARAGKTDIASVSESYYTPQRLRHIGKRLSDLLEYNSLDGCTQEDYEVSYIRFCDHRLVGEIVNMADWKRLLNLIVHRVHFHVVQHLPISGLTVLTLTRLWKVVLALRRKK